MNYITKVIVYENQLLMQKGNEKLQNAGWEIVNVTATSGGWGCLTTALLGCLFLPLALLGKKPDKYTVTYRILKSKYDGEVVDKVETGTIRKLDTDNTKRDKQTAVFILFVAAVITIWLLLEILGLI